MTAVTGTFFQMGSAPVLEEAMKFNEDRHRLILSNIANAETPGYRRQDLDAKRFTKVLDEAIQHRDRRNPGAFVLGESVRGAVDSRRGFRPKSHYPFPGTDGPLRHDQNNVSLEREMVLMTKNSGAYRTYARLLDKQWGKMRASISERVA